jgi:hypothetical protein
LIGFDLFLGYGMTTNGVTTFINAAFDLFLGYGMTTDGVTTFINAASCTKGYTLLNPPIIFDVPIPDGQSKESLLDTVDVVSFSKDALVNSDTARKHKRDRACHMSHDQLLSGIKRKTE